MNKLKEILPVLATLLIWVIVVFIMCAAAYLLKAIPDEHLHAGEKLSSYLTTLVICACGLAGAACLWLTHPKLSILLSVAWAAIFTNYFGYVAFNWSVNHRHLSAISFNIAIILQSLAILFIAGQNCMRALNRWKPQHNV